MSTNYYPKQHAPQNWLDGYEIHNSRSGVLVLGVPTWSIPSIKLVRHEVAPTCSVGSCHNYAYECDQPDHAPQPYCKPHQLDRWAATRGIIPSAHVDPTTGAGRNPVADEPLLTAPALIFTLNFDDAQHTEDT